MELHVLVIQFYSYILANTMFHIPFSSLSIFLIVTVLTIFGLCFLALAIPKNPLLHKYRMIRKVMAFVFFFFALANDFYFKVQTGIDGQSNLMGLMTLVTACIYIFFFAHTLTILMNNRFPGQKVIFKEILLVTSFLLLILVIYYAWPHFWRNISFPALCGVFVLMLLRYTYFFVKQYRKYFIHTCKSHVIVKKQSIYWMVHLFILMWIVSAMAFTNTILKIDVLSILFTIALLSFYSYFAISFINYPFHTVCMVKKETVKIEGDDIPRIAEVLCKEENLDALPVVTPYVVSLLDDKVKRWIAEGKYREHGITLTHMCRQIGTNQKYLSIYINLHAKNFREWINTLRMGEVKRLLASEPNRNTDEIAMQVGYYNIKYFRKMFRDSVGCNPEEFALNNISSSTLFPKKENKQ